MNQWINLIVFVIFSLRSVIEDVCFYRVKLYEIMAGIVVMIAIKLILADGLMVDALVGGTVGALAFAIVRIASKGRLGAGDVWFSAFTGLCFGFWTWDLGLLVAAVLGVAWIAFLRLAGKAKALRTVRIPFIPFMFAGSIAVSIYRGLR